MIGALVVGLTIVLVGGVAVGYYGLDRFAQPTELTLARWAHLVLTAQPV